MIGTFTYDAPSDNHPQTWNKFSYVENLPLQLIDANGLCPIVFGGITEDENTPGGKDLLAYAEKIGADVVFGYAGQRLGGPGDVLSILLGSAGAGAGVEGLRDAASQPGPLDVITFSGGAQTFLNSIAAASPGLLGRLGAVTYYSPGAHTMHLLDLGTGRSLVVFGHGLADDAATIVSTFSSVPQIKGNCQHDFPCEVGQNPPLFTGGRCRRPEPAAVAGPYLGTGLAARPPAQQCQRHRTPGREEEHADAVALILSGRAGHHGRWRCQTKIFEPGRKPRIAGGIEGGGGCSMATVGYMEGGENGDTSRWVVTGLLISCDGGGSHLAVF